MRPFNTIALVLLTAVMLVTGTLTVPLVWAQSTSITHLDAPSTVVFGGSATVRVGATYNLGSEGYAVSIGIFDQEAWWAYGTAVSESNVCHQNTGQLEQQAFCAYIPNTRTGSDVVVFQLTFSTVKTYRLRASVELYTSNAQNIASSNTFQDFTITVTGTQQSQPITSLIYQVYTPTYSNYQPTTNQGSPQTGFNPYPILEVGLIGAVVVVVLIAFVYPAMHKKTQNTSKPAKVVQEQPKAKPSPVASGKLFCLECGNELPLRSKFCNKCGTQQKDA